MKMSSSSPNITARAFQSVDSARKALKKDVETFFEDEWKNIEITIGVGEFGEDRVEYIKGPYSNDESYTWSIEGLDIE